MIGAWIVVHEDDHTDNGYWVFVSLQDAIAFADKMAQECAAQYGLDDYREVDVDRECHGDLAYHYCAEDCFRVSVEPVKIHEEGETCA